MRAAIQGDPTVVCLLRTAIHAFNDMQASLRDHMRRRTQTVAAIAHDLRTPLTRLRFRAEQAPDSVRDRMAVDIEEMEELSRTLRAFGEAQRAMLDQLSAGRCFRAFLGYGHRPCDAGSFGCRRLAQRLAGNLP